MKKISVLLLLLFYIGIYGDKVALFRDSQSEPVKVFPYSVQQLPAEDQEALRHGIPIPSKQELTRLLEDYFS